MVSVSGAGPVTARPFADESIPDWVLARTPFARLARTHILTMAGDTAVTVALAGTVFFSLDVNQAAGKVALSLVLTVAPFSVVAPFLGPAIDRLRGGRKLMLFAAAALRAVVAVGLARYLDGFWLFPLAFLTLVLSKTGTVSRAALVGTTVSSDQELVTANSRLTLLSTAATGVGGGLALLLTQLGGPKLALAAAATLFATASVVSLGIREPRTSAESQAVDDGREVEPDGLDVAEVPDQPEAEVSAVSYIVGIPDVADVADGTGPAATTGEPAPEADGFDAALDPRAGPTRHPPLPAAAPDAADLDALGGEHHHTRVEPVAADDGTGLTKPVPRSRFAPGTVPAAVAMGVLRFVVGFLTFMLAFGYRRLFTPPELTFQFGLVVAAAGVGMFLGSVLAPRLRGHLAEELMVVTSLGAVVAAGAVAYEFDNIPTLVLLSAVINVAGSSGRLAFDSLVQRDNADAAQGRAFASFEAAFQLVWVVGSLIPVLVPVPLALGALVLAGVAMAGGAAYVATLRHMRRLGFRTSALEV